MGKIMSHKSGALLLLVLLITLVASYALTKTSLAGKTTAKAGSTVTMKRILAVNGAEPKIEWLSVRATRSDGNFVERRTDASGKEIYLAFSHEGRFLLKDRSGEKLVQMSAYDGSASYTEAGLLKSPDLRKMNPIEYVQNEKCYVSRIKEELETGSYQDFYFSPNFNFPLKMVTKWDTGEETMTAVSIAYGEPDNALFHNLPLHLPIVGKPAK